jgi:hypothetical protein
MLPFLVLGIMTRNNTVRHNDAWLVHMKCETLYFFTSHRVLLPIIAFSFANQKRMGKNVSCKEAKPHSTCVTSTMLSHTFLLKLKFGESGGQKYSMYIFCQLWPYDHHIYSATWKKAGAWPADCQATIFRSALYPANSVSLMGIHCFPHVPNY